MLTLKQHVLILISKDNLLCTFKNIWNFLLSSNILFIMFVYTMFHLLLILSIAQGNNNPFFILAEYYINRQ